MEWTDEEGKIIEILSFFVKVYTNEETRRLNKDYNIRSYNGERTYLEVCKDPKKLIILEDILRLGNFVGKIVGVSKEELKKYRKDYEEYQELVQVGYLKEVENELIFPTEKLIKELEYLGAIRIRGNKNDN